MSTLLTHSARHLILAVAGAVAVAACHRSDWRGRLLDAARAEPFDADGPPVADDSARTPRPGPLTYAMAHRRNGDVWIVGRITNTSRTPIASLGVVPGVNYLWALEAGDSLRMAVVPADASQPAHWLRTTRSPDSSAVVGCQSKQAASQIVVESAARRAVAPAEARDKRTPPPHADLCYCRQSVWICTQGVVVGGLRLTAEDGNRLLAGWSHGR